MTKRIASWNANSISVRIEHAIDIMKQYDIDVLGVQETKTQDNNFPIDDLHRAGLHVLFNGQKSYNGTAFISRHPLTHAEHQLPGMNTDYQRRFLQARLGDLTIINCYVPNGKAVGDEKYHYKLKWLDSLVTHLRQLKEAGRPVVLIGDFNIAPEDKDVYDVEEWRDKILCSEPERERLQTIKDLGFTDTFRLFNDTAEQFSWWDYREGGFQKNRGHRIDLILSSEKMTPLCTDSVIEKAPRSWERPSDHTPVIATFSDS